MVSRIMETRNRLYYIFLNLKEEKTDYETCTFFFTVKCFVSALLTYFKQLYFSIKNCVFHSYIHITVSEIFHFEVRECVMKYLVNSEILLFFIWYYKKCIEYNALYYIKSKNISMLNSNIYFIKENIIIAFSQDSCIEGLNFKFKKMQTKINKHLINKLFIPHLYVLYLIQN